MCKILQGWLCLDFEELYYCRARPVYEMEQLLQYVQPDRLQPLIVVLDEVDEFLFQSGNDNDDDDDKLNVLETTGKKEEKRLKWKHKNTKKNWSRLLDTVQQKRNVIFILTSNWSKVDFDGQDLALMREYRVTSCLHYTTGGVVMR